MEDDPLLKLQTKILEKKRSKTSAHNLRLHMNLVEFFIHKKSSKLQRAKSAANHRGSEAYWNPESRDRVRAVQYEVRKLRKKRREFNKQIGDSDDEKDHN